MSSIISLTDLSPSSVFVDLGSGVGNCILQTALQAGCESYGVELLPVPSHCARLQLQEAKRRWAMWGINGNTEVKVEEGDMRGNTRVAAWLRRADVVVCLPAGDVDPLYLHSYRLWALMVQLKLKLIGSWSTTKSSRPI